MNQVAMRRLRNITAQLRTYKQDEQALKGAPTSADAQNNLVKTEIRGRVGIVTLNRPSALNALNDQLMQQVGQAFLAFDNNNDIGCIVLNGSGRAFAAGADIKEMSDKSYYHMSTFDKIKPWEIISSVKLPVVAAVHGFALGGGCEIAMMCDIIVASEETKFGQPEITIGTIPGAGGTQRLTKAVGKSKAMEMVLTGQSITAKQAMESGLVSRVVSLDKLLDTALDIANKIASMSRPVVILAKESVNASFNTTLQQGMQVERRLFHSTFALKDQKEGMKAFAEKRKPNFVHQ